MKQHQPNFQITDADTGKKYWISRSVATTAIIYAWFNSKCYVLIHRRGPGCPNHIGKLSANCGYLDRNEYLPDCAAREIFEETGFKIDPDELEFFGINDTMEGLQNITIRFKIQVMYEDLKEALDTGVINTDTVSRGGEKDEISEYILLNISDNIPLLLDDSQWAFGHGRLLYNTLILGKKNEYTAKGKEEEEKYLED